MFAAKKSAQFPGEDDSISWAGRYIFPGKTIYLPSQDEVSSRAGRQSFPAKTV
jgi:hypothetical protein